MAKNSEIKANSIPPSAPRPPVIVPLADLVSPSCDKCRHWRPDGDSGLGRCKRFPPSAGILKPTVCGPLMAYPVTLASDECGEFKAKS